MVIQRLQTLFLLIASVLMYVLCFAVPIAIDYANPEMPMNIYMRDSGTLVVLNALIATLLLISIFLFRNLKEQMRLIMVCILLELVSIGVGAFILFWRMPETVEVLWAVSFFMIVITLFLSVAAYNRVLADKKLLSSYNRLR